MKALTDKLLTNPLVPALIVMAIVFETQTGVFLSGANLSNVAGQSAILMVVTMPFALLLIASGVDLSVGSVAAVAGVVSGLLLSNGYGAAVALIAALAVGLAVGLLHGLLVASLELSPLIVTFGSLTALRGLALGIGPQSTFNFGDTMRSFGTGRLFGVPYLAITALCFIVVAEVVARQLPIGRHIYAIGVNERAAFLSGIAVRRTRLLLYVASAMAAAFGGFMFIARINSAPAGTLAQGMELDALTACLLGGIAFGGGKGNVTGAALGVVTLTVLQNGLQLLAVPTAWSLAAKGSVLAIAAGLQVITARRQAG